MKFNTLSHDEKLDIQKLVQECIDIIGGKNYFFKMIEDIRQSKPHPLLNKTGKYHFTNGTIQWKKEIYKDKIDAIKTILISNNEDNILSITNQKLLKDIKNSIKTLGKLEFVIDTKDGKTYSFKPFKTISDENVELDPMFQIIFFDSLNNTKRILSYK
jgi:hypothetical protein